MRRLPTSTNVAIFLIFFGIALLDAFGSHNWLEAAFWLAIGMLFVFANRLRRV
jgi:hypothetical protein